MGLMSATDARPSHTVHAILAVASERITSAWLSVGDPTAFVVADYADFAVQEDGRATTALNLSLTVAPGVAAEDFAAEVLSPFPPACAQAFLSAVPADLQHWADLARGTRLTTRHTYGAIKGAMTRLANSTHRLSPAEHALVISALRAAWAAPRRHPESTEGQERQYALAWRSVLRSGARCRHRGRSGRARVRAARLAREGLERPRRGRGRAGRRLSRFRRLSTAPRKFGTSQEFGAVAGL